MGSHGVGRKKKAPDLGPGNADVFVCMFSFPPNSYVEIAMLDMILRGGVFGRCLICESRAIGCGITALFKRL